MRLSLYKFSPELSLHSSVPHRTLRNLRGTTWHKNGGAPFAGSAQLQRARACARHGVCGYHVWSHVGRIRELNILKSQLVRIAGRRPDLKPIGRWKRTTCRAQPPPKADLGAILQTRRRRRRGPDLKPILGVLCGPEGAQGARKFWGFKYTQQPKYDSYSQKLLVFLVELEHFELNSNIVK